MFINPESGIYNFSGYLAIIILSLASSCGSLYGDFVFDDTEAVVNNRDVTNNTPIFDVLQNDFWGTKLTHNLSHKSYRPLTVMSFRANFNLFNSLVPWSFHLVNVVLHVSVCILLWSIYTKLLGTKKSITCLKAVCLFAVHPVHCEAVSGIVGRADLLASLFFCFSFLSYTRCTVKGQVLKPILWILLTVIFAAVAMLCKENGITVLGFLLVYELLVVQNLDFREILRSKRVVLVDTAYLFNNASFLRCTALVSSAVLLVWLRCFLMDFKSPTFQRVDNPASFEDDWLVKTLSLHYIVALNAWLLSCPDWLCFDWSMGCVPLINQILELRVLFIIMFWFMLVALIFKAVATRQHSEQREILLALSLLAVPFLPASNLFFRVGFVVAERVLYLPSAGFCLLVVLGMEKLSSIGKKDISFAFGLLLLVFLMKSHLRSLEWRTETTLFSSALRVCPLNAKVRYNVAKSAADRGMEDRAITEYQEAIRLYPEYDQALNNLANLLKKRGELLEAEKMLRKALKVRSEFPAAWMNLGIVLATRRQFDEAEKSYLNALKLRKVYPDCYYNMGNMYLEQKRLEEAERAWWAATELKPEMVMAWNNLIMMNDNRGNHTAAVALAEIAIQKAGNLPSFHFNMANALGKLGDFTKAEIHFKTAIQLDRTNALYYVNLGVLYHRWKKYHLAHESYLKALKINPKLKSAKQNYTMLKKQLAKMKS